MMWTARTVVLLVALGIGSAGAAWGLHAFVTANGAGTDYGLDTNGNGTFEWLVVEAGVSLPQAGPRRNYADPSAPRPPPGRPRRGRVRGAPPHPPLRPPRRAAPHT